MGEPDVDNKSLDLAGVERELADLGCVDHPGLWPGHVRSASPEAKRARVARWSRCVQLHVRRGALTGDPVDPRSYLPGHLRGDAPPRPYPRPKPMDASAAGALDMGTIIDRIRAAFPDRIAPVPRYLGDLKMNELTRAALAALLGHPTDRRPPRRLDVGFGWVCASIDNTLPFGEVLRDLWGFDPNSPEVPPSIPKSMIWRPEAERTQRTRDHS